ncbi:hypothetical protein BU17DRAFT_86082 [Hysterangium stoloniferum]|nr:hypothetical protein BU17DRAFT_86082 [Hysterangium stoloniferum]
MAGHHSSHVLALLSLMGKQEDVMDNPPLGIARRIGATTSTFDVPAHKLLQAVIEHSPSPETIAREFLVELGKCEIVIVKEFVDALDSDCPYGPDSWAAIVHQELKHNAADLTFVTDLGSHYLSHLVIAFRNPGGKKTPEVTTHHTPNIARIEQFETSLQDATANRSQSALRDLVLLRDGSRCLVTRYAFAGTRPVTPRCAHIIPFSVHSKPLVHQAIETFTGQKLTAEVIQHFINHPANAINIEINAHDSMDQKLAWGIEARSANHKWIYHFRVVRPTHVSPTISLDDGDEIEFGKGNGGNTVQLPDPHICNLHLAVARVVAASGAADVFDKYLEDDEDDIMQVPVYFDGPFVADDVLMRRLEGSVLSM